MLLNEKYYVINILILTQEFSCRDIQVLVHLSQFRSLINLDTIFKRYSRNYYDFTIWFYICCTHRCGCSNCIQESSTDSLRYSMSRVNEYRALASPSLISLSSYDPIVTTFKLSWELRNLAREEKECQKEYTVSSSLSGISFQKSSNI